MQCMQPTPGLDAEAVLEHLPNLAKHRECLCLAATPVEGQHLQLAQRLSEGISGDQARYLGHHLGLSTQAEVQLDAFLQRGVSQLFQPRALAVKEVASDTGQRRTPPQAQSVAEPLGGIRDVPGGPP